MNYQTWSKRKFWVVLVGVLLLGAMMGASGQEPQVADDTKEVEVVKEVKVENREAFEKLDALDQEIFGLSAEVIDAQSQALQIAGTVLTNLDTVTMADMETATQMIQEQTERINRATQQVESLQDERNALVTN